MFHSTLRRFALRTFTLALTCLPLVQAYVLRAQDRTLAVADVPFAFSAGGGQLPAGRYRIVKVRDSMVRFTNESTRGVGTFMVYPSDKRLAVGSNKLVFHAYDGHYFLSSVLLGSDFVSLDVVKNRAEKEAIHLAAINPGAVRQTADPIQIALSNGNAH